MSNFSSLFLKSNKKQHIDIIYHKLIPDIIFKEYTTNTTYADNNDLRFYRSTLSLPSGLIKEGSYHLVHNTYFCETNGVFKPVPVYFEEIKPTNLPFKQIYTLNDFMERVYNKYILFLSLDAFNMLKGYFKYDISNLIILDKNKVYYLFHNNKDYMKLNMIHYNYKMKTYEGYSSSNTVENINGTLLNQIIPFRE